MALRLAWFVLGGVLGSAVSVGAMYLYLEPYLNAYRSLSDPASLLDHSVPLDSLPVPSSLLDSSPVPALPDLEHNPASIQVVPFGAQK